MPMKQGSILTVKAHWLHSASNEQWTHFFPHARRGTVAMNEINILPHYGGTLCHDHWKPYYKYDCIHSLCNAHHLRELNRAWEQDKQVWAHEMKQLLEHINSAVNEAGGVLSDKEAEPWKDKYRKLLEKAQTECPPPRETRKSKTGASKKEQSQKFAGKG